MLGYCFLGSKESYCWPKFGNKLNLFELVDTGILENLPCWHKTNFRTEQLKVFRYFFNTTFYCAVE